MEQSLKTIGKYDAYGLRFDFDSAVLRPESIQLVREIAQMLTASEMPIGGSRLSGIRIRPAGPNTTLGYLTSVLRRCGDRSRTKASSQDVCSPKDAENGKPKANNDTLAGRAINRRVEFRRLDGFGSRPLDAQ